MTDFLTGIGITVAISIISTTLMTFIKKGQFESWGKAVGRFLSKFGNTHLGKKKWEKIEDTITLAILSFARGIKIGADEDDNGILNRIEDKLNSGGKVE